MDMPAGSSGFFVHSAIEKPVDAGDLSLTLDIEVILRIQAIGKGFLARKRLKENIRNEIVARFGDNGTHSKKSKPKNTCVLKYGLMAIYLFKNSPTFSSNEIETMIPLCQVLAKSMESGSTDESFAALFLSVEYMNRSTKLITALCQRIPFCLSKSNLNRLNGVKFVECATRFLFTFYSCHVNNWILVKNNASIAPILDTLCRKMCAPLADERNLLYMAGLLLAGLKGRKPILSDEIVSKLFVIALSIIKSHKSVNGETNYNFMRIIVLNFLTCPALMRCIYEYSIVWRLIKAECVMDFQSIILWLAQNRKQLNQLTTVESLNLLANFIHISHAEQQVLIENLLDWTMVVNSFLIRCQQQLSPLNNTGNFSRPQLNRSNNWHHPILGWISERIDEGTQGTFNRIREQLSYLWSAEMVHCLFGKVLASFHNSTILKSSAKKREPLLQSPETTEFLPVELMQRLLKRLSIRDQPEVQPQNRPLPPVSMTAVVCQLYQNSLLTFANTQIEILSGLCRNDAVLLQLWNFINEDRNGGLSNYLSFLTADPSVSLPHFAPLHLFADTAYSLISILDEKEMYESSAPFKLDQLREIARFSNVFCFKVIWENLIDLNERRPNALFQSIYQLCTILYNRDCRRSFTNGNYNFWTISEVKPSQVINEFERQSPKALSLLSRLPHVVPLHDRMVLFRKLISKDKEGSVHPTTVISINRARIVEDGYRQLSNLSSQALRGTIRVKFINQQGLDEAGIDQDGVFKEFLELTLKKVFDPELNLFKSTSNNLLYPSSTSSIHENHLGLFQFVGRMLAKAVYEGICVDVQLAPVLLATVLTKQLCPFDELASLDPVLYKNLTFVKHLQDPDEVANLELTFAYNEEFLGKIKTKELIVGGQDMKVCKENRILYIHKMAQFRVMKQTKEQTDNFVGGFRSVIGLKWLSLFNTHELQYLISGHTSDIDLEDLRKHAQYYGGFHSNHRLIKWLWSILQNDFTAEERHLFLKFVTSCSRAPLLGFAFLEPPFSIRCVETSDDMDQGDTLGSVIRGFLAIKRKQPMNRLPTASTCFNLLKLPNYRSRSVLLEKLRYAISAETGFELS